MEEAKKRLRDAIALDKETRRLAIDDDDSETIMGLDRRFEIVGRAFQVPDCSLFTRTAQAGTLFPLRGNMTLNFKNLIVGRHESKVLFMWNAKEGIAMLGAFLGIKDGIKAILAKEAITPAQRVMLEEFRVIASKNNWDFGTLKESLSSPIPAR
jgi:hypothetical protein